MYDKKGEKKVVELFWMMDIYFGIVLILFCILVLYILIVYLATILTCLSMYI